MAHYSYKAVMSCIPQSFIDAYEKKYETTFEMDGAYDGDVHSLAADYIDTLKELLLICQRYHDVSPAIKQKIDEVLK